MIHFKGNILCDKERKLTDERIKALTVDELNSGLRNRREDLRYTSADAKRAVELWNASKVNTLASLMWEDGTPQIFVVDLPHDNDLLEYVLARPTGKPFFEENGDGC